MTIASRIPFSESSTVRTSLRESSTAVLQSWTTLSTSMAPPPSFSNDSLTASASFPGTSLTPKWTNRGFGSMWETVSRSNIILRPLSFSSTYVPTTGSSTLRCPQSKNVMVSPTPMSRLLAKPRPRTASPGPANIRPLSIRYPISS